MSNDILTGQTVEVAAIGIQGLSGLTTLLEDFSNIDKTNLSDGSMLVYDNSNGKWIVTRNLEKQDISGGIIRIKRSEVSGNPSTLAAGELAYSALPDNGTNGGDRLYIGIGTETSGDAANHVVIGGKFFTDRLDHTAGTLTANSAIVVDGNSKIDRLNVDNLRLDGNAISITNTNGDLILFPNGSGLVSIASAYTLPRTDGTAGQALITNGSGVVSFTTISTTLNISGDTGTDTVSLITDTLSFAGGDGLTSSITNNTVTFDADSTIARRADTHYIGTTSVALNRTSSNLALTGILSTEYVGSTSGTINLVPAAVAGSNTITLPALTGTVALTNQKLNAFANTTSAELAGVITDETGSGSLVFATSPTLVTPNIGAATATSITGSGALTITAGGTNTNITLAPNGSGTVDVSSKRITSLADPIQDQDAATKAYVDAVDFPNIGTAADEIPLNQYLGALAYVDNISAGTGLTQETSGLSLTAITAGDNIVGAIKYNGTTKTDGQMYGGTSTPTNTTRLNYDGHLYATEMYAVNFESTSDQRAKTNIVTIDNALEKTLKLRGVEFDWKESGQHAIGVIAQEVEQIIPEVVNDNGELKSVSYGNIVGLLIEAIKEQQKQIEELQNKIK